MSDDATPRHGARFELRLEAVTGQAARYQAHVHTPAARHDYRLEIALPGGQVHLTRTGAEPAKAPDPEPWIVAHLVALGRLLYREAGREGTYKRRLMRWRAHE